MPMGAPQKLTFKINLSMFSILMDIQMFGFNPVSTITKNDKGLTHAIAWGNSKLTQNIDGKGIEFSIYGHVARIFETLEDAQKYIRATFSFLLPLPIFFHENTF